MEFEGKIWKHKAHWLVEVSSLNIMTQGKTRAEALYMIEQVLTQSLSFRGGSSELFVSYIYFFSFILFSIMLPIRCFS